MVLFLCKAVGRSVVNVVDQFIFAVLNPTYNGETQCDIFFEAVLYQMNSLFKKKTTKKEKKNSSGFGGQEF